MNSKKIFTLSAFAVFTLTSCTNFLNGSTLKSDIEEQIDYQNAASVSVRVYSEQSDTTPSGDTTEKVGIPAYILCTPDDDYEFIKWQVVDQSADKVFSDTEAASLVNFDDINSRETKFTLKTAKESLMIQPLCVPRPQILRKTPEYSLTGVIRDARIQIMFDQTLSEDSIYYSDEELKDLTDVTLLSFTSTDSNGSEVTKYYGYTDSENQVHFKNISIINANSKTSLLNCFNAPYFDTNGNYLVIPAKCVIWEEKTDYYSKISNEDELIDSNSSIIIELSQDIHYDYELNSARYPVKMSSNLSNRKWIYHVNDKTDSTAPVFTICSVKAELDGNEGTELPDWISTDIQEILKESRITSEDKIIEISGGFIDSDSGPASLSVTCQRCYDENYENCSEKLPDTDCSFEISGTSVSFNGQINLKKASDGIYRINITAEDNDGNKSIKSYFVLKDETAEKKLIRNIVSTCSYKQIILDFDVASDFKSGSLIFKSADDEIIKNYDFNYEFGDLKTYTYTFEGLSPNTSYTYQFTAEDIFGNGETTYGPETVSTLPESVVSDLNAKSEKSGISLSWKNPEIDIKGINIYYKTGNGDFLKYGETLDSDVTNCTVSNLLNGTKYTIKVVTVDTDGKESGDSVETTKATIPACVTNVSSTAIGKEITLEWEKPGQGDITETWIYVSKDKEDFDISYLKPVNTTDISYTFSTLSEKNNGTSVNKFECNKTYYFKLYSYYLDGSEGLLSADCNSYTGKTGLLPVKKLTAVSDLTDSGKLKLSWENDSENDSDVTGKIAFSDGTSSTSLTNSYTKDSVCESASVSVCKDTLKSDEVTVNPITEVENSIYGGGVSTELTVMIKGISDDDYVEIINGSNNVKSGILKDIEYPNQIEKEILTEGSENTGFIIKFISHLMNGKITVNVYKEPEFDSDGKLTDFSTCSTAIKSLN